MAVVCGNPSKGVRGSPATRTRVSPHRWGDTPAQRRARWLSFADQGNDTAFRVAQQVFRGRVRKVVYADQVHNYWPESQPPDDPAKSVQCWQCERLTWRYTPVCVHCGVQLRRGLLAQMLQGLFGR